MSENGETELGIEIPDKMFFKIREVAQIVGVKQHVLRYWETEFTSLSPKKNRNGQRLYTRKDVQCALEIRRLLHVERFSIAGARQRLKKKRDQSTRKKSLQSARDDLAEALGILDKDVIGQAPAQVE
ncbi:MAG: MerR family transcriptional regulator [Nitrospinota bacterium]|nr:MerR family transcriptional regulator [Nitrospinota bacterium]MDH5755357.1 MerR family transcriptional regulator [Nitrospinota bacterium]